MNNIFTIILFSYLIIRFNTIFHEIGHAIAISISKKILKYTKPLKIKIIVCGLHGITLSDFYYVFNNTNKEDTFKKNLIRFNALSGFIFDIVFYLILIFKILYPLAIKYNSENPVLKTIYILILCLIGYTITSIISSEDKKYILNPCSFTYDGKFTPKRKLSIDYPILFTIVSTIIGYSLPCLMETFGNITAPFIKFFISILQN